MTFEEHVENLKRELEVNPIVYIGDEAIKYLRDNGYTALNNGGYDHKTNTVVVIDRKRILTLAHEMRHAWQYKNREKYGYKFGEKPFKYWLTYFFSEKEKDAIEFAKDYGNRMGLEDDVKAYSREMFLFKK